MRFAILGAALALAGCGDAGEPAATETPSTPVAEPVPALEELSEADLAQTDLAGELACTFRRSEGRSEEGGPIFLGRGDVLDEAGAEGAVKYDGAVRKLAMEGRGGYDAMADGARFEGSGFTLTIATTGDEPLVEEPRVAMESPIYPATLTFTISGEAEQTIEGVFECGP